MPTALRIIRSEQRLIEAVRYALLPYIMLTGRWHEEIDRLFHNANSNDKEQ